MSMVEVDDDVAACREPGCGWEAYDGDLEALAADHRDNYRWHDADMNERMRAARARNNAGDPANGEDSVEFIQEMLWSAMRVGGPGYSASADGCGLEPVEE